MPFLPPNQQRQSTEGTFLRNKPYNIKMQVNFVTSINEHVTMSSDNWLLTPEIIVILLTRALPYVQCTENRPTCENYTGNYSIFQKHRLNSRRFPGFPGARFTKISYDLSYDCRKFIARSTYDSDLKRAEMSLRNIVI